MAKTVSVRAWAKAAMLERIRYERPEAERIRPSNASSNGAMLAINDAFGFKTTSTRTEWQVNVDDARRAVSG